MTIEKILERIYTCRKLYRMSFHAAVELEDLGVRKPETKAALVPDCDEFSVEILLDEVRWMCREIEEEILGHIDVTAPDASKEEMIDRYIDLSNIYTEASGCHDEIGCMPDWFVKYVWEKLGEQKRMIEAVGYDDDNFYDLEDGFGAAYTGRKLPERFYAKYTEANDGVAVFDSEAERDEWVMYKDEFSVDTGTTPENAFFQRTALTEEEARRLSCDRIYCAERFVEDDALDNVKWIAVPSYKGRKQYDDLAGW